MHRSRLQLSVIVAGLVATLVAVMPVTAHAGTDEGTQNPDLTVQASLTPDPATVGQPVTASGSIRNNTSRTQVVDVTVEFTEPSGSATTFQHRVRIRANDSVSASYSFTANEPGTYTLAVSATNRNGTSTATATTTAS